MKIYKTTDQIPVKIEGLTFLLSPLSFEQKTEIQALAVSADFKESMRAAKLAVKYSVKDVQGIEDFEVENDELGLSEECLDNLFNLPQNETLAFACLNLIKSFPKEFINPHTGEKLQGVDIVKVNSRKKK